MANRIGITVGILLLVLSAASAVAAEGDTTVARDASDSQTASQGNKQAVKTNSKAVNPETKGGTSVWIGPHPPKKDKKRKRAATTTGNK
jgi:hypothetical protein